MYIKNIPRKKIASAFKVIFSIILGLNILLTLPSSQAHANSFSYTYENTYTLDPKTSAVNVTQSVLLKSNSSDFKVPKGTSLEFSIPLGNTEEKKEEIVDHITKTLRLRDDNNNKVDYKTEANNSQLVVTAELPRDINPYSEIKIVLTYSTQELFEKTGQVLNIYVPGLHGETEFRTTDESTGVAYETEFLTTIKIPKEMGEPSLSTITPNQTKQEPDYLIYNFSKEQILGRSIWIQFGKAQIYEFEITQQAAPAQVSEIERALGLGNSEYSLILPADAKYTNQKVFYTKIEPEPQKVEVSETGNLIAKFSLPADFNGQIKAHGYLQIDHSVNGDSFDDSGTFSEIPEHMKYLTLPANYWESSNPQITELAQELKGDSNNVLETVRNDYEYIVSNINYDNSYVFGKPRTRKGALGTLQNPDSSVCMEYSDLFIAISRAQGIPARAAFGKGYDPNIPLEEQVGHQWAQVWVPNIGWISIDPTWGETGRDFIGYDVDHALWFVREEGPEQPAEIEVIARTQLNELKAPDSSFTPVEEIPVNIELLSQEDLTSKYSESLSINTPVEELIQSIPGASIILVLLPIIFVIVIFSSIIAIIRRKKRAKEYSEKKLAEKMAKEIEAKKSRSLLQMATHQDASKGVRTKVQKQSYNLENPFGK